MKSGGGEPKELLKNAVLAIAAGVTDADVRPPTTRLPILFHVLPSTTQPVSDMSK